MDEGPQVTDPGDVADSGARGDVSFSATETAADSGQQAPAGTAQGADQADGESAAGTETAQAAGAPEAAPLLEPGAALPPPEPEAGPPPEPETPESPADHVQAAELHAELTDLGARLAEVAASAAELSRLRSRDTDLIAKLHDDVTRLRSGEIAQALNPVVTGMIKLHDQMVSLGALADQASPVGMLHTQLLQIMELTCGVRPFMPMAGEPFDASHHTGTRRRPVTDASLDGTIAASIRAGFVRADGSVVRVAEVEVHRLSG
jgi:molecular chaperone GrpE (heat shock protein)